MVLIYPSRLMTTKNLRQPCALCKLKSPKKQCRIQGTSYAMASVVGSRVAGSLLSAEKKIGLLYYNRSFVSNGIFQLKIGKNVSTEQKVEK